MIARLIGLGAMIFGGWMVMQKRNEAAAATVTGPDVQVGPGGHEIAQQGAYAGAGADVLSLVRAINDNDFGGWFDVADVMAIIQIESSFRPDAYRFEAHLNDASYGLMQILSSTAADRGFSGPAEGLYDPETNIRYGMAQLRWSWDYLYRRLGGAPSKSVWIGSYNAGVGRAVRGYTPWSYVAKFTAARALWGARV